MTDADNVVRSEESLAYEPGLPEDLTEIIQYFPRVWSEGGHLFTETLYEDISLDGRTTGFT